MSWNKAITQGIVATITSGLAIAQTSPNIGINAQLWGSFSLSERAAILEKFPSLEITPLESIGTIQSVQSVNRSTTGTSSGSALGSTLGQAMYIDHAFSGSNNYSATNQLGAALLGGILGSSLDVAPTAKFIFNYAIRTLDGQIKEVRFESGDEFTRPVGQCVLIPTLTPAQASLCSIDKVQFIRNLSAISQAPSNSLISAESSGLNVKCRVPGVGLMTLEKNTCLQMEGSIEK